MNASSDRDHRLDQSVTLADRVREAFASRDLGALGSLLADDVRWGDDDQPRACRNRAQVLATFEQGLGEGADGSITEIETGPAGILCAIEVTWPEGRAGRTQLFHVYVVRDGLISEIRRFDDRESAARAAGLAVTGGRGG